METEAMYALITSYRDFYRVLRNLLRRYLETHNINAVDIWVLQNLVEHGHLNLRQVAELSGLTTGGCSEVIERLTQRHYVRRERHPTNRREIDCSITPEGYAVWQEAYGPTSSLYAYFNQSIDIAPEDIETVIRINRHLTEKLSAPPSG
ncbi:MAG: MarR family transcriptional regulator [Sulfobacillus sp.]|nr:MarR family transcriptional regulator [Sulfobacillus sp.]